MDCPSCGSARTSATGQLVDHDLMIWECLACRTQFTTQLDQDYDEARQSGRLVLNVDDRPPALYVRNRMLRRSGFVAADAVTGVGALARAVALRPNAILLDVHLPDCDGRDLCRTMREDVRLQHIPVVLVSATIQANDQLNPLTCGAAAFLHEPVSVDELTSTLLRVLASA